MNGHTLLDPFSFWGERRITERLAAIRRIPDDLWLEIAPILGEEKKPGTMGRPPVPFRKVLIRWEKKAENYLGLIQLACSIMVYRRTILG